MWSYLHKKFPEVQKSPRRQTYSFTEKESHRIFHFVIPFPSRTFKKDNRYNTTSQMTHGLRCPPHREFALLLCVQPPMQQNCTGYNNFRPYTNPFGKDRSTPSTTNKIKTNQLYYYSYRLVAFSSALTFFSLKPRMAGDRVGF